MSNFTDYTEHIIYHPKHVNLMWNISHPELVDKEEYETYDGIDDLKDKIEYYLRNPS